MIPGLGPLPESERIDLLDCFTWLTRTPSWLRTVAVGACWTLASLLLLPQVVLFGYGVRIIRGARHEQRPALPSWRPFGPLLGDGIRVGLVGLLHSLVAGLFAVGLAELWERARILGSAGAVLFLVAFVVHSLFFPGYIATAIARMTALDSMAAAFHVRQNLDFMRRNRHNLGRLLMVFIGAQVVVWVSPLLLCVGVFAASFWLQCTMSYALGRVLRYDQGLSPLTPASEQ